MLAHVDTVFARDLPHEPQIVGERAIGPGIGDNAAAVVCAVQVIEQLAHEHDLSGLAVAFTVAEEGLGNLAGAHAACATLKPEAAIALEGHGLAHVAVDAVGSLRARIAVRGPGGHSWANRGRPSAIDELCRIARALSRPARATRARTSAASRAATAVNAIAAHAELVIEQRALEEAVLARFARALDLLSVEPPLELRSRCSAAARPAGSTGASRCSRPCAACARSSACPTSSWPPPPTPTPRSRRASPRSASAARPAARCTRPRSTSSSPRWRQGREQLRRVLVQALAPYYPQPVTHRPHPLDPLSADEIERAVACVRSARELGGGVRFVSVELREPAKPELAAWAGGGALPPREAALVVLAGGVTHEAVVDLDGGAARVLGRASRASTRRSRRDEYAESEVAVKADAGFRAALALRGVAISSS